MFDAERVQISEASLRQAFRYDRHHMEREAGKPVAEQQLVERRDRGVIRHASSVYGSSVDGIALTVYLPESGSAEIVILAAIHGDEPETTVAISEALRCLPQGELQAAVILCGNPDGMVRGTRGNARGVDLNRNFPTSNWRPQPVFYKSRANDARDIALSPGSEPASEP